MISAKKLLYTIAQKIGTMRSWKTARSRIAQAYVASPFTPVALATSEKKISLSTINQVTDAGFTISDGGIKIPASGKYLVSAEFFFNTLGGSGNTISCIIKKGSSTFASAGHTHTGGYFHKSIPEQYGSFSANDVLYLYVQNNTAAVGNCSWADIVIKCIE